MEIILISVIAFATTNIDDIFILILFFGNGKFKDKDIVIGQYVGISVLITLSFIGSLIGLIIAPHYIGLLGLIPIYMGIKAVINLKNSKSAEKNPKEAPAINDARTRYSHILSVASVTIANGGDNVSIYIPLLTTLTLMGKLTMVCVFLGMTAIWCITARYLIKHPFIKKGVEKYGHALTPFIFIFLGFYILYESGTISFITEWISTNR